jgi:hypothetical protein
MFSTLLSNLSTIPTIPATPQPVSNQLTQVDLQKILSLIYPNSIQPEQVIAPLYNYILQIKKENPKLKPLVSLKRGALGATEPLNLANVGAVINPALGVSWAWMIERFREAAGIPPAPFTANKVVEVIPSPVRKRKLYVGTILSVSHHLIEAELLQYHPETENFTLTSKLINSAVFEPQRTDLGETVAVQDDVVETAPTNTSVSEESVEIDLTAVITAAPAIQVKVRMEQKGRIEVSFPFII